MGKISPPSIKYIINAKFNVEGVVEKPDVIGAIFGQTEGLLGEELELRELQKKGKIGRINAELEVSGSKTTGTIEIPTSIDKAETTIIAAAIETIDRIGPCDAKFEVKSVEDVRSSKREYILERAKKLMEELSSSTPELREMERDIVNHTKISKVREYGRELLAAGPNIESASEIIIVEGRADVLNLLKHGIKNAIAMNGTVIPETVKTLTEKKEAILFIDGDRGGLLISTDAIKNAKINFVARAPDGKEVEELTDKELMICLRNKLSVDDFTNKFLRKSRQRRTRRAEIEGKRETKVEKIEPIVEKIEKLELTKEMRLSLQKQFKEIKGTKSALLIGKDKGDKLKVIKKVSSSEIVRNLYTLQKRNRQIYVLIMDSTVTASIIRAAEKINCQYIAAKNFATTSDKVELLSF